MRHGGELALAPLVRAGLIEKAGVVVDRITGISGAGRALKNSSMFCAADSDVTAYGLLDHRHTPEIEQEVDAQVLFTPHLAPLSRGLLATCYARPTGTASTAALLDALSAFYDDEPFVVVSDASPSTSGERATWAPQRSLPERTAPSSQRHRQPDEGASAGRNGECCAGLSGV